MAGDRKRDRVRDRVLEGRSDESFRLEYEALGRAMARRRAELGVSQRELAALTGTTQSAIARLESGSRAPRLDTLLRVAHALGCELDVRLRPRTRGGSK
jgi:transcriptional regulator with XRE-family HTH domain